MSRTEVLTKTLISPVLTELKISDYSLKINSGSSKGDGYLGDIFSVKVRHPGGDIDLIVKTAAKDANQRRITRTDVLFRNEINFYTLVFPEMDELQRQVKNPLKLTRCYATSLTDGEETLVLQDLKIEGFRLCERRKPLDETHIILVLDYYAKLHALSFALRSQRPEVFKKLTNCVTNVMPLFFPNFMDGIKSRMRRNSQMLRERGLVEEANAAERIIGEAERTFFMNDESADEYSVITHGDCWSNNMLFKYDVRECV